MASRNKALADWVVAAIQHWSDRTGAKKSQAELGRALAATIPDPVVDYANDRTYVNKLANGRRPVSVEEMIAIEKITGLAAPRSNLKANSPARETVAWSGELAHAPMMELRQARLPIRGHPMAGKTGAIDLSSDYSNETTEVDQRLASVRGAYAVRVVGTSMLPVYRPGQILGVHPGLEPVRGDDVVIQLSDDSGATIEGYVKRLISIDEKHLSVEQFNPPERLRYPRRRVWRVHRIVTVSSPW